MSITPMPTTETVRIEDRTVVFDGFVEDDLAVVDTLAASADPTRAAHELLALGARLSGVAAGTGGLRELEARVAERLERLTDVSRASVETAATQIAATQAQLLDPEEGAVSTALATWRADLEARLGEMFNPADRTSVIAAIEASVTGVLETQARRLVGLTDPDDPASMAGRLLTQVRQAGVNLAAEVHALAVAVGARDGAAVEHTRSAVKGAEFEAAVLAAVAAAVGGFGDQVDAVGTTPGSKGSRKGDILVSLSPEDATDARFVLEAKDTPLSLRATWRELDAAMANRDAQAGIACFASAEAAPSSMPFFYAGSRAIVVLDREDLDPAALQLACLWARWVVRRSQLPVGAGPDPDRMRAAIESAQRALGTVSSIRRSHSVASRAIEEARGHLDEMIGEVRGALAELATELGS